MAAHQTKLFLMDQNKYREFVPLVRSQLMYREEQDVRQLSDLPNFVYGKVKMDTCFLYKTVEKAALIDAAQHIAQEWA